MKKSLAIALLLAAPGLFTFGIALACLYTMPVCHVMQQARQHPCCAKQPAAHRDAAVRVEIAMAPPEVELACISFEEAGAPVSLARSSNHTPSPPLSLRV